MQCGQHPVGGHHRQRRSAAALTQQHRHRRGVQRDQLGQALGDLAGQPALLGFGRQRRAGGVDHQHQRQAQFGGQRHAATGLAQRRGPDPAHFQPAGTSLLAQHHRGLAGEPGQCQQRRRGLALPGTGQQHLVGGAVSQQVPDARPVRAPRRQHRVPRRRVGDRFGCLRGRQRLGSVGDHRQRTVERVSQIFERDDGIDHPVPLQVLRGLDAGRECFAVKQFVHPGAQKPDKGARLGEGDMAQRAPRRENPAGGGVAQVDQVRQVCLLVQSHGRGDLHHLQKRHRALLHAGAARTRRGQQRQPLGGGALHGGGDPFGGRHPDRPGEEVELADHHRYPAAEYASLAGQHRFVPAGGALGVGELPRVGLGHRHRQRRAVPADE